MNQILTGIPKDSSGNIINTNPEDYKNLVRTTISQRPGIQGSIIEDEVKNNLKVDIIFINDSSGNIRDVKVNYIMPKAVTQDEYETAGVPYIKGKDSSGNFIYETNVNNKTHTENKIRDEHGLQERGQY